VSKKRLFSKEKDGNLVAIESLTEVPMCGQKQNPFEILHINKIHTYTHEHLHGLCELSSSCSPAAASQKTSHFTENKLIDEVGSGCGGAEFDSRQSQKSALSVYWCVYVCACECGRA
jgi:hypothetical protein